MKTKIGILLKGILLSGLFFFWSSCSIEEEFFFWIEQPAFNEESPIQLWILADCKLESLQSQTICYRNGEKVQGSWLEKGEKKQKGKEWYRLIQFVSEERFSYGDQVEFKIKGVVQFERKRLIPLYQKLDYFYIGKKIPLFVQKNSPSLLTPEEPIFLSISTPFPSIDFLLNDFKNPHQSLLSVKNSFQQETELSLIERKTPNSLELKIQPIPRWQSCKEIKITLESDSLQIKGDKESEFFIQTQEVSRVKNFYWKKNSLDEVVFQINWDYPIQIADLYSHCFFSPPLEGRWKKEETTSYSFLPTQLKGSEKNYQWTLLKGVKNFSTGLPSPDYREKESVPLPDSFIPQILQIQLLAPTPLGSIETITLKAEDWLKPNSLYPYKITLAENRCYFRKFLIESNTDWNFSLSNDLLNAIRLSPIMPDSGISVPQKRLIGFSPDQKQMIIELQFSKADTIPFPVFYIFSFTPNSKYFTQVVKNSAFEPISFYLQEVIE